MEKKKNIKGYTIMIDRLLGEGAFGKVYVGEQDKTKLKVAIKAMTKSTSTLYEILVNRDPYIRQAFFS